MGKGLYNVFQPAVSILHSCMNTSIVMSMRGNVAFQDRSITLSTLDSIKVDVRTNKEKLRVYIGIMRQ